MYVFLGGIPLLEIYTVGIHMFNKVYTVIYCLFWILSHENMLLIKKLIF